VGTKEMNEMNIFLGWKNRSHPPPLPPFFSKKKERKKKKEKNFFKMYKFI
jgi:hypothetical protein